jgi:hypothetical protein
LWCKLNGRRAEKILIYYFADQNNRQEGHEKEKILYHGSKCTRLLLPDVKLKVKKK